MGIELWIATANHGFYGSSCLSLSAGDSRSQAARAVLEQLASKVTEDDRMRLNGEMNDIIEFLQTHKEWKGGPSDDESMNLEYVHVRIERVTHCLRFTYKLNE